MAGMKTSLLALVALVGLAACAGTAGRTAPGLGAASRIVTGAAPAADASGARWTESLDAAVDAADVVLVGEYHDQRPHHLLQRDVLARMAAGRGPVLLGMEMFQRPGQQALDDYVAGRIGEVEMLRRTEYFTRWGYDHTFYAPLWRLCRERGIRIVALNPDGQINRKVGRQGLSSLTPEERAGIAAEIDTRVASHRARILGPADAAGDGPHGPMPPERREGMYQAMCVWDETMAESAAHALSRAGRGARMMIAAGAGHIAGFDGIHDRLLRRMPGLRALVVVCDVGEADPFDEEPAAGRAHFTVRMPRDPRPPAPLLGVRFREGTLTAEDVSAGGNGARMGLRAGDTIVSLSGTDGVLRTLSDVTDLKHVLGEFWQQGGRGGLFLIRRADGTSSAGSYDLAAPAGAH